MSFERTSPTLAVWLLPLEVAWLPRFLVEHGYGGADFKKLHPLRTRSAPNACSQDACAPIASVRKQDSFMLRPRGCTFGPRIGLSRVPARATLLHVVQDDLTLRAEGEGHLHVFQERNFDD